MDHKHSPAAIAGRSGGRRRLALSRLCFGAGVGLAALTTAQPAWSQTADDAAPSIRGDIIVTAQKRDQRLLDVPVSVSAVSAASLISGNLNAARDFLTSVPGVQINERAPGRTQISIRGINTGNGNNPLIGITIDDVPFGSSTLYGGGATVVPDLDPFILSEIEVLRGPQGTLYGASSMGGLLKYQTRMPSLTATSGAIQIGTSQVTASGDEGYTVRAAISTPLILDKLSVSASGFYRQDGGYIRDPGLDQKNQNDVRSYGGRISLLAQLSDTFRARASAIYQHQAQTISSQIDTDALGNPIDGDLTHRRLIGTEGFRARVEFYTLDLEQELGSLSLSSLTGYSRNHSFDILDRTRDSSASASSFTGVPNAGVVFYDPFNNRKITEELKLASDSSQPLSIIAGLFYNNEKSFWPQSKYAVNQATGQIAAPRYSYAAVNSTYKEYAAYATVTWKITPKLELIAGGRFSHTLGSSFEFDDITGSTATIGGSFKENPFTFNASAQYHVTPNVMVYARAASGYRAGGGNTGLPAAAFPRYNSDKLINYEAGIKGRTADGLVTGTLSAYYIDWRKIQVGLRDTFGNGYVTNAGKARSEGFEGELTLRPVRGLSITGTATYDDAALKDAPPVGNFFALSGDRLPYSAKWTATAGADYRYPLNTRLTGFLGGNLLYTGRRLSDFVTSATQVRFTLPAYTTADLRAGVDIDNVTLNLFVRNVTDRRGFIGARALNSGNRAPFAVTVVTPRTVGGAITLKF